MNENRFFESSRLFTIRCANKRIRLIELVLFEQHPCINADDYDNEFGLNRRLPPFRSPLHSSN